jgi:hypothetical protein
MIIPAGMEGKTGRKFQEQQKKANIMTYILKLMEKGNSTSISK